MNKHLESSSEAKGTKPAPLSWGATLAGILPFLIIGFGGMLLRSPHSWALSSTLRAVGGAFFMGGYLVIVVGLGIGWVKGFPRWVYPYIVYSAVFALYLSQASTPGLRIFGYHLFGRELWGWRAWVPLGIVVTLALLVTRFSLRPLLQLVKDTWRDWTRLSFGLYGIMPFVILIGNIGPFEVHYSFQFPSHLILVGGTLAYMRSPRTRGRALALLTSATVSLMVMIAGLTVYWDGRMEPWIRSKPDRWYDILQGSIPAAATLLAILFAPALLGLLRHAVRNGD